MTTRRAALFLCTLAALAAPAALSGCSPSEYSWPDKGLHVAVTLPPLDSFVRKVLGDHGTVKCLAEGPDASAEDFEPSREDAVALARADVLFINGLGLDDDAVETLRLNGANPKLKVVALAEAVPESDRLKDPDGAVDPHVWTGITQAVEMVHAVRDRLKEADPDDAADYDKNADDYVKELKDLLKDGRDVVGKMPEKDRKIFCLGDPVRYFAADLGLDVVGAAEVEPGEAPSETRRTEIAEHLKKTPAGLIAVPQPYPAGTAKEILEDLRKKGVHDVDFIVLDPMESAADLAGPDWYKEVTAKNIEALKKTLPQ